MFCTNCGKQVADNAKFCPNCGSPTITNQEPTLSAAPPEPQAATNKKALIIGTKKIPLIIGAVAIIVVLAISGALLLGGESDRDKAIKTVRAGYLGTFTDVTVEEIVNYTFAGDKSGQGVVWDGGTTDDGVMIVEARYTDPDGQEIQLQFRMMDDKTFRYGGMTDVADLNEAVKYLNMMYYNYYVFENPGDLEAAKSVVNRLDQVSCGAILCGASADYEGDRENLYQSAFDMEPLPATAANYLGLLDATLNGDDALFGGEDMLTEGNENQANTAEALPAWCSGNYYGDDIYSTLSFYGSGPSSFDISIYRLVTIENCTITAQNEYEILFKGDFDIDVGSVSGTLESYDGKQITLTITESDWNMLPTGTMMEFYYDYQDEYYSAHLQNGCSSDICGIYVSMDIPANRLFVWENDENISVSIQNWGNLIALGEITPYEMEWIGNVLNFSGYTIGDEEQFSGNYDSSSGVIELHPVADDSVLFTYSVDGLFAKAIQQ